MLRNPLATVVNPDFKITVGDIAAAIKKYNQDKGGFRQIAALLKPWDDPDISKLSELNRKLAEKKLTQVLNESEAFELITILLERQEKLGHLSDTILKALETKLGDFMSLFRYLKQQQALKNLSFTPIYAYAANAGYLNYYIERLATIGVSISDYAKIICAHPRYQLSVFELLNEVIKREIQPLENIGKILKYAEFADRMKGYWQAIVKEGLDVATAFTTVLKRFDMLTEMEVLLQAHQIDIQRFHAWFFREASKFYRLNDVKWIFEQLKEMKIPLTEQRVSLICQAADRTTEAEPLLTNIKAGCHQLQAFLLLNAGSLSHLQDYLDYIVTHPQQVVIPIQASLSTWTGLVVNPHAQVTPKEASKPITVTPSQPEQVVPISIFSSSPSPERPDSPLVSSFHDVLEQDSSALGFG